MAEPRDPLQVRVDDEHRDRDRPEPADDRVELEHRDEEDGERHRAQSRAPAPRVSAPDGSSRIAVRGLRASSSASTSRLRDIASVRAPTIATVTQTMFARPGQPSTARNAPTYANGSANTVCSMRTSDASRRGSGTAATFTSADAVSRCRPQRARARGAAPVGGPRSRPGSRRASRQVHDEGRAAEARDTAREQRMRSLRDRVRTNRLGEPRRLAVDDRVASPRASRRAGRSPFLLLSARASTRLGELRVSPRAICVASSSTTRRATSKPSSCEEFLEHVAARSSRTPALTPSETVSTAAFTRGSFVFSTSRTSSIAMPLSIAFAMS